jgi:hypothetical protein
MWASAPGKEEEVEEGNSKKNREFVLDRLLYIKPTRL